MSVNRLFQTDIESWGLFHTDTNNELKEIKNNYERLESMYHDSLEDVNNVRSEYEAKLILACDNFVTVKAENEALKERVDVLFKLGRSYINSTKKNNARENERIEAEDTTNSVEENQIVEEDVDNIETLQAWTKNKMRGFKRVSPSAPPAPGSGPPVHETRTPAPPSARRTQTSAAEPEHQAQPAQPAQPAADTLQDNANDDRYRGRYCHFFVNTGKCSHEERTGEKCKFLHTVAPMCNFGNNCSRPKCMFSHPKMAGNRPFLGHMRNVMPMMNPWQMPNPWMTQQPNQFQNQPWNYQQEYQRNQSRN